MKKKIRIHQFTYIGIWITTLLYILLSESEYLPTGFIGQDATTLYLLDILAICLTLCGTYTSLRLLSLRAVKEQIRQEKTSEKAYLRWNTLRLCIIAVSIWGCAFLYYATLSTNTAQYCLLICLWRVCSAGLRKPTWTTCSQGPKRRRKRDETLGHHRQL